VLILSGYVVREVSIRDRVAAELAGPEDLLYTSQMVPGEELLPFSIHWSSRGKVHIPSTRGTRAAALEELHARLTEQRELLRLASVCHQRQLSRLRDRSDRLRATTHLSALARLARGSNEYDGWLGDADGVAEPARDVERTG